MTLEELRKRFWWLGPDGSYVTALRGDQVTVKVIQTSWVRRTQTYEESVARDFVALGFRVQWEPFFADSLETEIARAKEKAEAVGKTFDRATFIAAMRKSQGSIG